MACQICGKESPEGDGSLKVCVECWERIPKAHTKGLQLRMDLGKPIDEEKICAA